MFASLASLAIFPAPMNFLISLMLVLFVLVALLMVLVILMQRPKSEGLGACARCRSDDGQVDGGIQASSGPGFPAGIQISGCGDS